MLWLAHASRNTVWNCCLAFLAAPLLFLKQYIDCLHYLFYILVLPEKYNLFVIAYVKMVLKVIFLVVTVNLLAYDSSCGKC